MQSVNRSEGSGGDRRSNSSAILALSISHPTDRSGLMKSSPAKSFSLSVTIIQSWTSATAATIISSALRPVIDRMNEMLFVPALKIVRDHHARGSADRRDEIPP
jgi:hypothetical protein